MCQRTESDNRFNWELFGSLLRKARKDEGFINVDMLSDFIDNKYGYKIATNSIYRIEQGVQVPSITQFWFICMAIYGRPACPKKVLEALLLYGEENENTE